MKIEEKYVGARVRVSAQGTAVGKRKKKKTERQSKMERKRDQRTKQGRIKELMSGCKSD